MIDKAEIVSQPFSGQYEERIYNYESENNSQSWTFVKFYNEDFSEWIGHFRGFPKQIAVSKVHNLILVLTSDYLYELDKETGNLLELEIQTLYQNLTLAPNGSFLLVDYSSFTKVTTSIKNEENILSPIKMDNIQLIKWENRKLQFTCEEYLKWERSLTMAYDCDTNNIETIKG
jgi:hypothetical protein